MPAPTVLLVAATTTKRAASQRWTSWLLGSPLTPQRRYVHCGAAVVGTRVCARRHIGLGASGSQCSPRPTPRALQLLDEAEVALAALDDKQQATAKHYVKVRRS